MLPADFNKHKYLHKYFENIKKLEFFSYITWGPWAHVSLPRPGSIGGPSTSSTHTVLWNHIHNTCNSYCSCTCDV